MINNTDLILKKIVKEITEQSFEEEVYVSYEALSGGCINKCFKLTTTKGNYFVKINDRDRFPNIFELEAKGLNLLRDSKTILVPDVIKYGEVENYSFLILEFINEGSITKDFWKVFGEKLALLHQNTNKYFGLEYDNYIATLVQYNNFKEKWIDFFIENRLEPRIKECFNSKLLNVTHLKKFEKLYLKLNSLMPEDKPSLLHGDLWRENFIVGKNNKPYLIDPAVYYGHREAEIAFTTLFGRFNDEFYHSYNEIYPLEKKWEERLQLYNLYHLLVHLKLFGFAYLNSIENILKKYS